LLFRGRCLKVEVTKTQATYTLVEGEPLEILHHGEKITASTRGTAAGGIPPAPERAVPSQPAGRAPIRRGKDGEEGVQ
jgi:alpha,alpha-trehalose phosphorylase